MATFLQSIDNWIANTGKSLTHAIQRTAEVGLVELVNRTPKYTENMASHWNVGVNTVDTSYDWSRRLLLIRSGGSANTAANLAEGRRRIMTAKWGDYIALSNNAPYARHINSGAPATQVQWYGGTNPGNVARQVPIIDLTMVYLKSRLARGVP